MPLHSAPLRRVPWTQHWVVSDPAEESSDAPPTVLFVQPTPEHLLTEEGNNLQAQSFITIYFPFDGNCFPTDTSEKLKVSLKHGCVLTVEDKKGKQALVEYVLYRPAVLVGHLITARTPVGSPDEAAIQHLCVKIQKETLDSWPALLLYTPQGKTALPLWTEPSPSVGSRLDRENEALIRHFKARITAFEEMKESRGLSKRQIQKMDSIFADLEGLVQNFETNEITCTIANLMHIVEFLVQLEAITVGVTLPMVEEYRNKAESRMPLGEIIKAAFDANNSLEEQLHYARLGAIQHGDWPCAQRLIEVLRHNAAKEDLTVLVTSLVLLCAASKEFKVMVGRDHEWYGKLDNTTTARLALERHVAASNGALELANAFFTQPIGAIPQCQAAGAYWWCIGAALGNLDALDSLGRSFEAMGAHEFSAKCVSIGESFGAPTFTISTEENNNVLSLLLKARKVLANATTSSKRPASPDINKTSEEAEWLSETQSFKVLRDELPKLALIWGIPLPRAPSPPPPPPPQVVPHKPQKVVPPPTWFGWALGKLWFIVDYALLKANLGCCM